MGASHFIQSVKNMIYCKCMCVCEKALINFFTLLIVALLLTVCISDALTNVFHSQILQEIILHSNDKVYKN